MDTLTTSLTKAFTELLDEKTKKASEETAKQDANQSTGDGKEEKEQPSIPKSHADAIKQNHAFREVLKAHNINFDVDKADLSQLEVKGDKLSGEFKYNLPTTTTPTLPAMDKSTPRSLTMKDIEGMSQDQINNNWKEVSAVLASQGQVAN